MDFFVYENWQAEGHKTRIHRGDCSFCNYGKGNHPEASDDNGKWHGPFETIQVAADMARAISPNNNRPCKHCFPK